MTGRRAGILLAFSTACISGVAIWVNGHAVTPRKDGGQLLVDADMSLFPGAIFAPQVNPPT